MTWPIFINLVGLGVLVSGILLLIWSLSNRKEVSAVGVGLLIAGFLLQILAAFIELGIVTFPTLSISVDCS
jgi:cytochrome bd-type quinol oxidase subunit 2